MQSVSGLDSNDPAVLTAHPAVRAYLQQCLNDYNKRFPGNSTSLARLAFMERLPDPQRHEISDKGTINQRIAAENRSDEIAALFAPEPDSHTFLLSN
jgi:feruloyl-CoA synthase